MKAYKYVGKEYTVVRLDEKSFVGTKVFEGQVIESDRNPAYFLTAGFEEVDVPVVKSAPLEAKPATNKTSEDLITETSVSENSITKKSIVKKPIAKKASGFSNMKKKK